MFGEELSAALGEISNDKIQEAACVYKKKKRMRSFWLRGAAVAATVAVLLAAFFAPWQREGEIITAPGVLKVYAYDYVDTESKVMQEIELREGVYSYAKHGWNIAMNLYPGLPLTLSVPEEQFGEANIYLEIDVSGGEFFQWPEGENGGNSYVETYLGQHFTVGNDQTIYWWIMESDMENLTEATVPGDENGVISVPDMTTFLGGIAYVDIIVWADKNIVGCMTVKICAEDMSYPAGSTQYMGSWYHAELVGSVGYPMVDGKYQYITREYVENVMEGWKK